MIEGMRNAVRGTLAALPLLLAVAWRGDAQARPSMSASVPADTRIDRRPNAACTSRIPVSEMAPVVVYAYVDIPTDTVSLRIRPAAQVLVARIARNVRTAFGAGSDGPSPGEPRVRWQGVNGEIHLIAHRDGRLIWTAPEGDSLYTSAIRAVASALRAVTDSGGRLAWPDSIAADSAHFTISLHAPILNRDGFGSSPKLDRAEPLFQVMQPWIELARPIPGAAPILPQLPKAGWPDAVLPYTFFVDASGRADAGTARELRRADHPPRTGAEGRYYDAFARSIRDFLKTAQFEPARIGGCPVSQTVRQSFDFRLTP